LGVLELENAISVLGGGHLDGDTTTVGVGGPVLVEGVSDAEGLHAGLLVRDRPEVNIFTQVVHDINSAVARIAGLNSTGLSEATPVVLGKGGSGGGKKAGKEDVESHDGNL